MEIRGVNKFHTASRFACASERINRLQASEALAAMRSSPKRGPQKVCGWGVAARASQSPLGIDCVERDSLTLFSVIAGLDPAIRLLAK